MDNITPEITPVAETTVTVATVNKTLNTQVVAEKLLAMGIKGVVWSHNGVTWFETHNPVDAASVQEILATTDPAEKPTPAPDLETRIATLEATVKNMGGKL